MQILTNVTVEDQYDDSGATIQNVLNSNGGYFLVSNNDVFMQMQYNIQGQALWTQEIHIPTGSGQIYPGTVGIRFRNFVAGSPAVVSAALSENREPAISIGASGVTNTGPTPVSTTYRKTTSKKISGTVAASDLLNGEIVIAPNAFLSGKVLRADFSIDWKNNSGGAAAPPRFQFVLGGTTVFDTSTAGTVANTANRSSFGIKMFGVALADNVQAWTVFCSSMAQGWSTTATVLWLVGEGNYDPISGGRILNCNGFANSAQDMTSAQSFVLNVINGSASANYDTTLYGAVVEIF